MTSIEKSKAFVECLEANNLLSTFDNQYILELGKSAPNSMSQFLKDYRHFLLSSSINYPELIQLNLEGAYGWLSADGLFLPHVSDNNHLLPTSKTSIAHSNPYDIPSISDFDTVICEGKSDDLLNIAFFNFNLYLGFCTANKKEAKKAKTYLTSLLFYLNYYQQNKYVLANDSDTKAHRNFYYIKKK